MYAHLRRSQRLSLPNTFALGRSRAQLRLDLYTFALSNNPKSANSAHNKIYYSADCSGFKVMFRLSHRQGKPRGLKWRSSIWYVTLGK